MSLGGDFGAGCFHLGSIAPPSGLLFYGGDLLHHHHVIAKPLKSLDFLLIPEIMAGIITGATPCFP